MQTHKTLRRAVISARNRAAQTLNYGIAAGALLLGMSAYAQASGGSAFEVAPGMRGNILQHDSITLDQIASSTSDLYPSMGRLGSVDVQDSHSM